MSDYSFNDFADIDDDESVSRVPASGNSNAEDEGDVRVSATVPNEHSSFSPITKQDVEKVRESEGFDGFDEIGDDDDSESIREEDVQCLLATTEANAALEKRRNNVKKIIIGIKEWVVELVHEGVTVAEKTGSDKSAARKYEKEAQMPKITFAAPAKQMPFAKKLVIFLIVCAAVGIFFGVKANSYFWYNDGKVESAMACAWGWLMVEKLPVVMSPIQSSVFFAGFAMGFGILGIIGLFIWLDNDAKKQSRVGHEHGNARLGTKRDFTIYKRKFMD